MNKNAMKLAIWMKRFKEREELKLTVHEYCERIGEPRKKYYYWHKKAVDLAFAQPESDLQPAPIINNPVSNKTPCFAEYSQLQESVPGSAAVIVCGSARIEIPDDISEELLLKILRAASHV